MAAAVRRALQAEHDVVAVYRTEASYLVRLADPTGSLVVADDDWLVP
ncbi:MAG: hypothetical protein ACXVDD_16725 [Polyangia bacterium]